jgi:hypothetical protein
MRYQDSGEVHKDFHLATNRTIDYIMTRYDEEFLSQLCRRTAQDVYRDIHSHLISGDSEALLEHLAYYTEREAGQFAIERAGDRVVFHMESCPMHRQIIDRGQVVSPHMGRFLELLYGYWADRTPFTITVENYHGVSYDLCIRRNHAVQ